MQAAPDLFSYKKYWAHRFGTAPVLPMSRSEMDELGWDSCDIILVTGDAYVDQASFGMALVGRVLEAQGFRVGIIAQPDWQNTKDFERLGKPNLYFGVTGGNMDSMVNRYTSERRVRSNDAYTPDGAGGQRPDRCVIVYTQRCREAFKGVPVIIGGIEASLRRIAHYDYWSEKVRRSVLLDSKADMLMYGNAERQIVEITHRMAKGEMLDQITDVRGTAFMCKQRPDDWWEINSTDLDQPGRIEEPIDPYLDTTKRSNTKNNTDRSCESKEKEEAGKKETDKKDTADQNVLQFVRNPRKSERSKTVIRIPAYEDVKTDPVLYAHTSRILHLETNPGNARALIQQHGAQQLWLNPPPIPLTTKEMDAVYDLDYTRQPHPAYGKAKIPAYEMIRFSVPIMRGCFGGCTFCSITEHEGRIIQNRSEDSIIKEIETIRDKVPEFTGVISDLGGPTANMYRLSCKSSEIESACRKPSCVYPGVCDNLKTNHDPLIKIYRRARKLPGIKKILIASGLRYDLAVLSPEYVKELVTHHVGGYLKIAPEHTESGPLSKMMKPGIGSYDKFKNMFEKYSKEAGKEQYLIPYFIAAHPGTTDEDMMNLAIWLKQNGFRADQVQAFLPSPMATASAMYYSGKNPLKKVTRKSDPVFVPKGKKQRQLHKAFLRYHDANNWPLLREALKNMGRADLIGNGKKHLIPNWQPAGTGDQIEGRRISPKAKRQTTKASTNSNRSKSFKTQHTGLPKTPKAPSLSKKRSGSKRKNRSN